MTYRASLPAEALNIDTLAARHPQVQEILRDAMDRIVQRQRKNNVWTIWSRQFRSLLAPVSDADKSQVQTGLQGVPEAVSGQNAAVVLNSTSSEQWTPVSFVTAESRGCGMPPAKWRMAQGQADHQISRRKI